jgi:hypothetical protein
MRTKKISNGLRVRGEKLEERPVGGGGRAHGRRAPGRQGPLGESNESLIPGLNRDSGRDSGTWTGLEAKVPGDGTRGTPIDRHGVVKGQVKEVEAASRRWPCVSPLTSRRGRRGFATVKAGASGSSGLPVVAQAHIPLRKTRVPETPCLRVDATVGRTDEESCRVFMPKG